MWSLLKVTRSLYKAVSGRLSPNLVAWAFGLGLLMALIPMGLTEGFTWLIVLLMLFTRASIGVFLLPVVLLGPLVAAWLWRPIAHVGKAVLETEALRPLWTTLVDLPGLALLGLDRYAVMGGLVCGLVLAVAAWVPIRLFVRHVRERVVPRAEEYRIVRWFRGFWLTKVLRWVFVGGPRP